MDKDLIEAQELAMCILDVTHPKVLVDFLSGAIRHLQIYESKISNMISVSGFINDEYYYVIYDELNNRRKWIKDCDRAVREMATQRLEELIKVSSND